MSDKKLVDSNGKLLGLINVVDFTMGLVVCVAVVGFFLVQSGYHVTSGQVVEGESDIRIAVEVANLATLDKDLFVPGQTTALTIRNQPRGSVLIEKASSEPVALTLLNHADRAVPVPDLRQEDSYDYTIWLKDHATKTKEGYVTNGVKVKVGLPIELEGFKYRVTGKIVDVQPANNSKS